MIIVTPRGPVRLLDALATAIWGPIITRAEDRAATPPEPDPSSEPEGSR